MTGRRFFSPVTRTSALGALNASAATSLRWNGIKSMRIFIMRAAAKMSFVAVTWAVLLSCSQTNVASEQKWLSFRCPDGQTVMAQFQLPEDEFVNVRFAGREMRLPHVISGSGARYSDGKTTFWNRGKSVLMQVDDKIVVQDCMLE
jgi:membrane-bound inhibitor of C-type lysozyme